MGLRRRADATWESPFDYEAQALLYVPERLPSRTTRATPRGGRCRAAGARSASGGRAFLLFTSLRAMRGAHELLQDGFKRRGFDFPLLVQGEGPRSELLERFRRLGNAVLVGSQSFWEGVDVRGEALSVVMIDELPFAPPDDPVLAARIEKLQRARDATRSWNIRCPQAVITLKQGAGRLIRDETDRGVLMICDPRLVNKPYGRRIWQSLPPMRRTRERGGGGRLLQPAVRSSHHHASQRKKSQRRQPEDDDDGGGYGGSAAPSAIPRCEGLASTRHSAITSPGTSFSTQPDAQGHEQKVIQVAQHRDEDRG